MSKQKIHNTFMIENTYPFFFLFKYFVIYRMNQTVKSEQNSENCTVIWLNAIINVTDSFVEVMLQ